MKQCQYKLKEDSLAWVVPVLNEFTSFQMAVSHNDIKRYQKEEKLNLNLGSIFYKHLDTIGMQLHIKVSQLLRTLYKSLFSVMFNICLSHPPDAVGPFRIN